MIKGAGDILPRALTLFSSRFTGCDEKLSRL